MAAESTETHSEHSLLHLKRGPSGTVARLRQVDGLVIAHGA